MITENSIQIGLFVVSIIGVYIAYLSLRNDIRKNIREAMNAKMDGIKTIINLKNRVEYIEKNVNENKIWQKEEFAIIRQKLDEQNVKLEGLSKEFVKYLEGS